MPDYAPIIAARKAITDTAASGRHVRESLWQALDIAEARYRLEWAEARHAEGVAIEARHYPEVAA